MITSRSISSSAPAGYRVPREVIALAVCWYLRYRLSYRDVEELLAERGIAVDHVTVYRWVQTFTPEFIDAARRDCCVVGALPGRETGLVIRSGLGSSAPAGYRFPREVIALAVRWYLRYGLSYRDVEELLVERGIEVDHVTVYRWVRTFTSEFVDAARPSRHAPGDRWFVDETYVKIAGRWTYLYRAVDQHGQVIDVLVSERRDGQAARAFFIRALKHGSSPVEVTTDRAPVYPRLIEDLAPQARHVLEQYANNRIEGDHGRLKARLRPMRGLKTISSLRVIGAGHAFIQNLRRGHYEHSVDVCAKDRVRVAFTELGTCL